jgi:hypothetical protein
LGLCLRTVAIRFVAIARFLRSGFCNIPTNFRRTLFVVDLRHPAELVPGYSGPFANTSTAFLALGWNSPLKASSNLLGYVAFFVPAYLYRLSIKSTCWLYLPLVYIANERERDVTPAHFVDRVIRGGWELWRRALALLTLIAFAMTTYASILFHEFTGSITHRTIAPKIISPIEFMFQFDFSGKWWQYCSLAGALITGWLFLQAKEMRVDLDHAKSVVRQVDRVKLMMRVRNVLSVALILMVGVHALLMFSPIGPYLPAYMLRGLGWFYGMYMPPYRQARERPVGGDESAVDTTPNSDALGCLRPQTPSLRAMDRVEDQEALLPAPPGTSDPASRLAHEMRTASLSTVVIPYRVHQRGQQPDIW